MTTFGALASPSTALPEEPWSRRTASESAKGSALLVDDDPVVLRGLARVLAKRGYEILTASDGAEAIELIQKRSVDVILSDIAMPGMDGIELLREVRRHDLYVPVILITGEPAVATAVKALEYGAFHYLTKPATTDAIDQVLQRAIRLHRVARVKEQAAELLGQMGGRAADRAGLEASFQSALSTLWVAYQPIVSASSRVIYGYEALLRSNEPSLPHPGAVLDAAERLGELTALGRTIRSRAAEPMGDCPNERTLFVNLHVRDLLDPTLADPSAPLSRIASRVVLEITERSAVDEVKDVKYRVAALREMGFRIAIDDMGAGYAGLTSFALLEPEVVKLDMSLVRDVHESATKQKVIRSMTSLCQDMGMLIVAEGVETPAERDALQELGCDLLQGYLFAKPARPFPEVQW
jgi:EAL domain-containing protein (putative c-di-GMP-specific phosphodiesterase class I)